VEDQGSVQAAIQWERVVSRMLLYASSYKRKELKLGDVNDIISNGVSPSDLVCKVITDFCDGKIPPKLGEPLTEAYLLNLLKKAYREELIDLLKKPSVKTSIYADDIGDTFLTTLRDTAPPPIEFLQDAEKLEELYRMADGHPDVQEMIKAICEGGCETPREIAAFLNTSVADIYNRKKKMKRMYENLMSSYQGRKKVV
jgi:hypothetical protein